MVETLTLTTPWLIWSCVHKAQAVSAQNQGQGGGLGPANDVLPTLLCSFLYEPNSQGYKYYRQKLEEFRKAKAGPPGIPMAPDLGLKRRSPSETLLGSVPSTAVCPTSSALSPAVPPAPPATGKPAATATVKRKRKSRWGPEEDKVELPPAELVQKDVDASPSPLSGRADFFH